MVGKRKRDLLCHDTTWRVKPKIGLGRLPQQNSSSIFSIRYSTERYCTQYTHVLYDACTCSTLKSEVYEAPSSSRSISGVDSYQSDRWEPSPFHASQANIETNQKIELKWIHDAFGNFCTNFAEIALFNRSANNPFETSLYRGRCTIAEVFLRFEDRTTAIRSLFSDSLWWPRG